MNKIVIVDGVIRNIEYSHQTGGVNYNKAEVLVKNQHKNQEDVIIIKFKEQDNIYKEGDIISFCGQLRSHNVYSSHEKTTEIYVFTDFTYPDQEILINSADISGRICLKKDLILDDNRCYLKFILANNIFIDDKKLNSYIPCIAYGKSAIEINELDIGSIVVVLNGKLKSKTYTNQEGIVKVSHQLCFLQYENLDKDVNNEL